MDKTPNGKHEIRKISGNAEDIINRGTEIESLGTQMLEASGVLALVKDGAQTRGKSLESIKDSVGDAVQDLKKAGERYKPSGTHLLAYGRALASAQSTINVVVPEAERLWGIYETKLAEYNTASGVPVPDPTTPVDPGQPDPTQQRADDVAAALTAKNKAYDDWELEAGKYDAPYESWDKAYDAAHSGLKDANDDGIKDSFWDNALPAIEVILTVLSYAGMVLAVAAIIIGGPLIAVLAAVVGLVALGLTIWKVAAGRGNGWDIAIAVVGVLPFGKIAGAFKGVVKAAPGLKLAAAAKGGREALTDMAGLTNLRQVRNLKNVTSAGRLSNVLKADGSLNRSGTARVRERFAAMANASNSSTIRQRLMVGQEGVLTRNVADAFGGGSNVARTRVTAMLADSPNGRVVQDMISGGREVGAYDVYNTIDSVVKPAGGFVNDRVQGGWGG